MKLFRLVLVCTLVVTSCKSSKTVFGKVVVAKKMSARKVSKKHIATLLDKETIEIRSRVRYQDNKSSEKISVKLRIEKDKVIWLNATVAGFLVARAKITPTRVSYYEKINRTYFDGDFTVLRNFLGMEVDFSQLQNLLLGQAIVDLKAQKYKSTIDSNAHLLSPVQQNGPLELLFWINPAHFKLDKQLLRNRLKDQQLEVSYTYMFVDKIVFPKKIVIKATEDNKFTNIDIDYKSVVFNKDISTPFRVPKGYKQVVF